MRGGEVAVLTTRPVVTCAPDNQADGIAGQLGLKVVGWMFSEHAGARETGDTQAQVGVLGLLLQQRMSAAH